MNRRMAVWTQEEFDEITRLHAQGIGWDEIARRVGRGFHATRGGFYSIRSGKTKLKQPSEHDKRRAEMIERVEAGERVCDAARAAGVKRGTAYRALHRAGLDAEVRREYRDGPYGPWS